MKSQIVVLEGLDGSGKTFFASQKVREATLGKAVSYLYFQKLPSPLGTLGYWKNSYVPRILNLAEIMDYVIVDRSIISTYVYHPLQVTEEDLDYFALPLDTKIIYFDNVVDSEKLRELVDNGYKIEALQERYETALKILKDKGYNVIRKRVKVEQKEKEAE